MDDLEIECRDGSLLLRLRVAPGARKAMIKGVYGGALKLSVTEPPEKGRANAGVVQLLADCLGIPQRQIELVSGHGSHDKRVKISGIDEASVRARLNSHFV
ncbi:MAG: DUF167 domain-containing protein [Planctomycetes bacterium]|nr:DUF167 domain-containing protein [Planctomycetota bacterium]